MKFGGFWTKVVGATGLLSKEKRSSIAESPEAFEVCYYTG